MLFSKLVKSHEAKDPITLDTGAILHAPSDDEDPPVIRLGAMGPNPPCGCSESSSDLDDVSSGLPGHNGAELGCCAPGRVGGNPYARRPQRQRTDSQVARGEKDVEFR